MTFSPFPLRRVRWGVAAALATLTLTGCAPSPTPVSGATGVPAASIDVALQVAGCTTRTCFVAGATVGGLTEAAYLQGHQWISLPTPATTSASLTSVSCNDTTCLVGGTDNGHDLLWTYGDATHTVAAVRPATPLAGIGVDATACSATTCLYVDHTGESLTRLVSLATPTVARPVPSAPGSRVVALRCRSELSCRVAASGTAPTLNETSDGGGTWQPVTLPTTWTGLTDLWCDVTCVALATTASGPVVSRGPQWRDRALTFEPRALSCLRERTCLVVGATSAATPVATWVRSDLAAAPLTYVPTPLTAVGCGGGRCAAVGATTIVVLRP